MTKEEKLEISPDLDRGRWYSAFFENDAGTYKLTFIDAPISASTLTGQTLTLPENFVADDVKYRIIGGADTSGSVSVTYKGYQMEINLPDGIDNAHLYIHGFNL